jgi:hypothetical protein
VLANDKTPLQEPVTGSPGWRWSLLAVWCVFVGMRIGFSAHAGQPGFGPGVAVGRVTDGNVTEASGLAASRRSPGVLWTHNDAGSSPRLFALSTNGAVLRTLRLAKAQEGDFEDVAIGPGPRADIDYLYFADIGDNDVDRENVRVYRVPEPAIYPYFAASPSIETASNDVEIVLEYPDGPHDAEALLVDPLTGDLFIATKQRGVSQIYRATRSQIESNSTVRLERVRQIDFDVVSGGAISFDGREIILRREDFAQLWVRASGESVVDALGRSPMRIPVFGPPTEPNGEGISFHPTGLGYYTLSEGSGQRIYFFPRTSGEAPPQPVTLVPAGSQWRYLDDGSDQQSAWRQSDYADSAWKTGAGQFGYGQSDEQTVIGYGVSSNQKHVTTYFRTTFNVADPAALASLQLTLLFDDGVGVYLNGTEVLRRHLGPIAGYADMASVENSQFENVWSSYPLSLASLRPGTNTLAVEVHRHSRSEADLSFDLQLTAVPARFSPAEPPLRFTGPPVREGTSWRILFSGPLESTVTVESSSNPAAVAWQDLGRVTLTNGSGNFLHNQPAGAVQFYRLQP